MILAHSSLQSLSHDATDTPIDLYSSIIDVFRNFHTLTTFYCWLFSSIKSKYNIININLHICIACNSLAAIEMKSVNSMLICCNFQFSLLSSPCVVCCKHDICIRHDAMRTNNLAVIN